MTTRGYERRRGEQLALDEVRAELQRQHGRWGEQNHPDGTGSEELKAWAERCRAKCKEAAARGEATWKLILIEEVAEALAETDETALVAELVQVAAVCVQWILAIARRRTADAGAYFAELIRGAAEAAVVEAQRLGLGEAEVLDEPAVEAVSGSGPTMRGGREYDDALAEYRRGGELPDAARESRDAYLEAIRGKGVTRR